jgi:hypothetical protein
MPPRRTSPRRATTRPTGAGQPVEDEPSGPGAFAAAAPWIALLALVAAVAAFAFVFLNRGTDLSAWPSAKHFTSWLCLAPGNKISGGKMLSARPGARAYCRARASR